MRHEECCATGQVFRGLSFAVGSATLQDALLSELCLVPQVPDPKDIFHHPAFVDIHEIADAIL